MMGSDKLRLNIYTLIFTILLSLGTVGFMFLEGLSFVDSLYFSIVTMATVGYGDIHPQSGIGKILSLIMIVGGVGTFLGVVASITDLFVNRREEAIRKEKLSMVTGLFFSEMGNALLAHFSRFDPDIKEKEKLLHITPKWNAADYKQALKSLKESRFKIDTSNGGEGSNPFPEIKADLQKSASLLLRLIENPIIQEHESFTDLLRAIFHLRDELLNRSDLSCLHPADQKHLDGDMVRVYGLLIVAWLRHMQYMAENYTYLFSLAVRTNPFNPDNKTASIT